MTFTKNNLLNLDAVTALELKAIFKRADYLQTIGIDQWESKYAFLHNRIFVNMFFESSTRNTIFIWNGCRQTRYACCDFQQWNLIS